MEIFRIILILLLFILFALIIWPIYAIVIWPIYALISTIFKGYFYERDRKAFDEAYKEARAKGIFIDYPPQTGHIFGPGSRLYKFMQSIFMEEDDEKPNNKFDIFL